ncbi:MAG: hypothetical protein AAGD40_01420 [Pseudomonadota bacterium]
MTDPIPLNADLDDAKPAFEDEHAIPSIIADSIVRHQITPKRRIRTKEKAACELVLDDGTTLTGHIFVGTGERVLDCLNDSRPFFPFLHEDGTMLLLAKSTIAVCRPLEG